MNGAVVGLVLGIGLLLVAIAATSPSPARAVRRPGRVDVVLASAGLPDVRAGRFVAGSFAGGLFCAVLVVAISGSPVIGAAFGTGAVAAPFALVSRRAEARRADLRAVWPDVVDNLASAVRAGLSLPEALAQIGTTGPDSVAPAFARFATDYRTSGRFGDSLDGLKDRLADPVADRIVEALRLTREVGGSDLGRLLRALSAFLREDERTRGELETRQGWTVNAARLAAAAPWVTLALLSLRPEAVQAYDSASGVTVLVCGAAVTFAAYRLMVRLGRLPAEARVLR